MNFQWQITYKHDNEKIKLWCTNKVRRDLRTAPLTNLQRHRKKPLTATTRTHHPTSIYSNSTNLRKLITRVNVRRLFISKSSLWNKVIIALESFSERNPTREVVINVLNVIIAIPIGLIHTSTVSDSMGIWLKEIFTLVKHDERAKESKKPEWLSTCNTFFFNNARLITTGQ